MSKSITNAVIIGATGLVGEQLVNQLIALETCQKIKLFVRKPHAGFSTHKKVEQVVIDNFMQLKSEDVTGFDFAFSCLGTTLKKAGSKDAFYHIDYEINAHFAQLLTAHGTHFVFISAMGANSQSVFFYNQVKGELEDYVQQLDLAQLSILRPSLLLGERPEARTLEDLSQQLFQKVSHFIPKRFKYRPVTAAQVAHTMVVVAQQQTEKRRIYDNLAIQQTQ